MPEKGVPLNTMDGLFGRAKPQTVAFVEILRKKRTPRGKRRAELFEELKQEASKAANDAKREHYFSAYMRLLFLQGMALALDVITPAEIEHINNLHMKD